MDTTYYRSACEDYLLLCVAQERESLKKDDDVFDRSRLRTVV